MALGAVSSAAGALTSGLGDFWDSRLCPGVFSGISSSFNSLFKTGGVGQQGFFHFQKKMQWKEARPLLSTSQCGAGLGRPLSQHTGLGLVLRMKMV